MISHKILPALKALLNKAWNYIDLFLDRHCNSGQPEQTLKTKVGLTQKTKMQ